MRRFCKPAGSVIIAIGVLIILALVLPTAVWWFILGVVLVVGGLVLLRKR
jgi:hypothetical protein